MVLEELIRNPRAVTGRQLAMQLVDRLGKSRVFEVLQQLVDQGLVNREIIGPSHLYSINQKHLCYELLKKLTQPRDFLIDLLVKQVSRFSTKPDAVVLFGSIAKGTSKPGSDVDLLVVRPNRVDENDDAWQDQLFRLTLAVQRATGNDLNYLDYSNSELARLAKAGHRLIKEVNQHGLLIAGKFQFSISKAS